MKMKQFWLVAILHGLSEAIDCKHWRRSITFDDPRPEGAMKQLPTMSSIIECFMICSQQESCPMFSFHQQTGNCTVFSRFMISSLPLVPGHVFYKVVQITVTTKTGPDHDAFIDSKVFLKMYGSFGETNEIELVDNTEGKLRFESGQTDVLNMTSIDVGILQRIKIGHDNSADKGWLLDTVTISVNGQPGITFAVNDWLEDTDDTTRYKTIDAP